MLVKEISLDHIKAPIAAELKTFESSFRKSMKSRVPLLDRITHYIVKRKGKHMRPLFVLLSAKMFGEIPERAHRGAALIELLHTATLVHDDVVDNAYERRGFFSVNALWKNKIAVLVGDYILSKGLLLSIDNGDFDLLQIVSRAVKDMSEGELLQIEKARKLDIVESVYYDIIRQKTASLIASACACGAAASGQDSQTKERMWTVGENIGIAFQIKDDLFDFGDSDVGKPRGIDIKEKKLTLPLIYALANTERKKKQYIVKLIKNHADESDKVSKVVDFVRQSGGIQHAQKVMEQYRDEALNMLREFPLSEARQALEDLVVYTIERKK